MTYCIQWANNSNVHMGLTYFVWKNNYDILWRGLYKHKHSLHAIFSFQLCLSLKFQQDLHLLCFFNLFIHSASLSFCPSCLWLISPGCFPCTFNFSGLTWCPNPLVSLFIFDRYKWQFLELWSCFVNMANQFIKMYPLQPCDLILLCKYYYSFLTVDLNAFRHQLESRVKNIFLIQLNILFKIDLIWI